MKCAFFFNGHHYLAPSKKEARKFMRKYKVKDTPRRFKTTWRFKTIEKAPSFCQIMKIGFDNVTFGDHQRQISI